METVRQITEDEMVAEFLKAELNSPSFRNDVLRTLKYYGKDKKIIEKPDIKDKEENEDRADLFGYRGYGKNGGLFKRFPEDVKWERARMGGRELYKVKYIDKDPVWNILSDGKRLPSYVAKNIKNLPLDIRKKLLSYQLKGRNPTPKEFLNNPLKKLNLTPGDISKIREEIKNPKGKPIPLIILVAENKESPIVVLEGHKRLTAYCFEPEPLLDQIEVIIGYSEKMDSWVFY